jgi:crossover junction endodeoxyribonuclease RuvC
MSVIIGLDLSLTATGCSTWKNGEVRWGTISSKQSDMRRLHELECLIAAFCSHSPNLVVLEDLALASRTGKAMERAGLAYIVRLELWRRDIPFLVVPPMSLKKFTSGSGASKKEKMLLEVYKRWGHDCGDDNQADAVALAYVGAAYMNEWTPTMAAQREVLRKLHPVRPASDVLTPSSWVEPSSLACALAVS